MKIDVNNCLVASALVRKGTLLSGVAVTLVKIRLKSWVVPIGVFVLTVLNCSYSLAIEDPGEMTKEVGISQKQGQKIDLGLNFVDQDGKSRSLGELTGTGKATILVPAYYHCPRMCGLVLQGVVDTINDLDLTLGKDFQVVTLSFDPTNTTAQAAERFQTMTHKIVKQDAEKESWHFLTGDQASITDLMKSIGYNYLKDGEDFAHSGAIVILTPGGDISQYFLGIEFPAWHVRLALVEASRGSIGSAFDQVLLFCFRFDHLQGKYIWAIVRLLQVVGVLTILFMGTFFYWLTKRKKVLPQATL